MDVGGYYYAVGAATPQGGLLLRWAGGVSRIDMLASRITKFAFSCSPTQIHKARREFALLSWRMAQSTGSRLVPVMAAFIGNRICGYRLRHLTASPSRPRENRPW